MLATTFVVISRPVAPTSPSVMPFTICASPLSHLRSEPTEFKMFEAERLAEKIDLDTSRSPLGLEGGTVYVLPPPDSPAYPNLTTQANEEDQASDLDKTPEEE